MDPEVAEACDFLTPHWNNTQVADIAQRVKKLKSFGKPIVCNEDDKTGERAVLALHATIAAGAGYGLMLKDHNQTFPFHFDGAADDALYYAALKSLTNRKQTTAKGVYFPLPESQGGWRKWRLGPRGVFKVGL